LKARLFHDTTCRSSLVPREEPHLNAYLSASTLVNDNDKAHAFDDFPKELSERADEEEER